MCAITSEIKQKMEAIPESEVKQKEESREIPVLTFKYDSISSSTPAEKPKAMLATEDSYSDLTISPELKKVLELYEKYAQQQTNINIINCVTHDIKTLKTLGIKALAALKIELPIEEIIKTFEETGVIVLRKVDTFNKLLLGCGNAPCDPRFTGSAHLHAGFITINPALSMNPTVIGAFGVNPELYKVLPKEFYEALYGEAVSIAPSMEAVDKNIFQCMKPGFKTYELGDPTPYPFEESSLIYNVSNAYGRAASSDISKISNLMKVLELYQKYAQQQTNPYIINSVAQDIATIQTLGIEALAALKIELPIEAIIKTFEETGVIVLRKVDTFNKLLLGCGNGPCNPRFAGSEHLHEGFITINPSLSMNPTVIGAFGINPGLYKVLPREFYEALHGEVITIASSMAEIDKNILQCMKPGFKTYEVGDPTPYSFEDSNLFFNPLLETCTDAFTDCDIPKVKV